MSDAELNRLLQPVFAAAFNAAVAGKDDMACAAAMASASAHLPLDIRCEAARHVGRATAAGRAKRATSLRPEDAPRYASYFAAESDGSYPSQMAKSFGCSPREFAEATGCKMKVAPDGSVAGWVPGTQADWPDDDDDLDDDDFTPGEMEQFADALESEDEEDNVAHLATLQEMILACHAEGDTDTAAWLASIADDPATVAQVTGGGDPSTFADWEEDKHPRGQPGNRGQFGPGGGGKAKTDTATRSTEGDGPTREPSTAPTAPGDKDSTARADRRQRDATAADHVRRTTAEPPRPKHLDRSTKFHDIARRRRIVAALKVEAEVAKAIKGFNEPDSRPADVVYLEDADGNRVTEAEKVRNALKVREASVKMLETGKVHKIGPKGHVVATEQDADEGYQDAARAVLARRCEAFEVKCIFTSGKDQVYINPRAKRRKFLFAERHGISFSVVAVDKRRGKKHSGHDVYVAPYRDVSKSASGTVKLDDMKKVASAASIMGALE